MAPPTSTSFTDVDLSAAHSLRGFDVHRAACEWQLDRHILLHDKHDRLSRDKIDVEPYEHQEQNLLTFCRLAPVALIADDVGLGKTISAGLILLELMLRKKVRKALVVCPKILVTQWQQELTDKFRLPVVVPAMSGEKLHEAVRIQRGVIVTTYDTVRNHFDVLGEAGVQMLILDEAHRLRRLHGPGTPPQIATRIRAGLEQRWFNFVLLLTATPIQNRAWDLYSLIDLLAVAKGHRHPLGTPEEFAEKYLQNQTAIDVVPRRREEFRRHVRRYIVRTRRADAKLPFPERMVELRRAPASKVEQELGRVLGRHLDELSAFQQISLAQALMSSPEALVAQLENMTRKAPQLDECLKAAQGIVAEGCPSAKIQKLGVILSELRQALPDNFRLLIFTLRRETQNVIGAFLKQQGISYGFIRGESTRENRETIDRFTKEPPEVHVVVSTEAGAEGVNLQAANMLINYDLPWNPMIMEQRIGRIQRLGSQHKVVTILNLVVADSVEERVVERLTQKLQLIGNTVGEIDAILESSGEGRGSRDDDAGESFQEMIRKLVVAGLQGKDVNEDVRLKTASIDNAKRLLEENRAVIDTQLEKLDELHTSGPAAPNIPIREPSMSLETFVLTALQEEGAVVTRSGSGLLDIVPANGPPSRAAIGAEADDSAPAGVTRYAPGEPAFELLVQRWAARDAALVYDRRGATDEVFRTIAARWCEQIPGAVLREVRQRETHAAFQGDVDCVVRAGVAHDNHELIVSVPLYPDGHTRIPYDQADSALVNERAQLDKLFENAHQAIEKAVEDDAGIREYRRFYDQRREEELRRITSGVEAKKRVQESWTPAIQTRIVGLRGHRYEVVRLHLAVELDAVPYETEVAVVPPTAQVLTEPEMGLCEQSGRHVPASWLETCCASKKQVLSHLLQPSELSGRRALPGHLGRSAITDKRLLLSEMEASAVSGALAEPELLVASEMSRKKGLLSEIALCEFTGAKVLVDELVKSQVSGRMLRKDQRVISAVSNVLGHRSEFVTCEVTQAPVLEAERVRSEVSGRWVRKDQIVRSEKPPHRTGAAIEGAKCAATGKMLLCDEVAISDASGKVVDRALLVKSEASDRQALDAELVTCALSGKRVLPQEVKVCAVTGRRALPTLMVKSAAEKSTLYMLPGSEICSAFSNKPMAPSEVYVCPWLGYLLLPEEAVACKLTGLKVAPWALNAQGELDALRRVLDNPSEGANAPDIVAWLKQTRFYSWNEPRWARAMTSPSGKLRAVAVHADAFLTSTDDGMLVAVGPTGAIAKVGAAYAIGDRHQHGWTRSRSARW